MYSVYNTTALNPSNNNTFLEVVEAQPPQGTCDTAGTALTLTTGKLQAQMAGLTIIINGVNYTLQSVTDATHGTLASTAGTQTGVAWSIAITAEEVAQNQCVNDAGGAPTWEIQSSSWVQGGDVDYDASSGGNPLKLFSVVVINNGVSVTKSVVANDQGSPTEYAGNVALETALTNAGYGASGNCNTSGTAVTATSGSFPLTAAGLTITINGVTYTIASVTDATHLTLSASAGTQTGVAWSFPTLAHGSVSRLTKIDVKAN